MGKSICMSIAIVVSIAFSGCAAKQQPLTPEEQSMRTKMMQAMVARMQNSPSLITPQASAVSPVHKAEPRKIYSEPEVASMAGQAPILTQAINFDKKKDGFTVDGVRYFDPEGEISNFNSNSLTGEVSYFVKTGGMNSKTFTIKYMKAKTNDAPVTLAIGTVHDDYIQLETVTGKKMKGIFGFNTSKGFALIRNETGFLYTVGKGITSFAAPDGYHFAERQQGDIESTGFVLLEKDRMASAQSNPIMGVFESASSLGSALGINDKKDYALMNIRSGKVVELNVSYDKTVQNNPLFMQNGLRNSTHYFWRIRWFKGLNGTYAFYRPNASKEKALELNTGKEVTLFDSIIGSVDWKSEYTKGNKLKVTEIKMLGTGKPEVVEDFEMFFQSSSGS